VFCFLECGDSGFTRHGGKPHEKLFERLSALQIIEESLDWDSRSTKHRSSPKNIRVFGDHSHERIVSRRMKRSNTRGTNRTPPAAGRPENRRNAPPANVECGGLFTLSLEGPPLFSRVAAP
jgi:hypothetical protein